MKKHLLPALAILALLPATLSAAPAVHTDSARITALEQRIADLENRIAILERNQSQGSRSNEVIIEHRTGRDPVYVCSISPFRKTYEATSHNEGLARAQVRRACNAEQNAIFCADTNIRCQRYD
ncbi:hypothetical protein A7P95_03650 [Eikenella longinqua]|uniref:Periplasmic protein n=1 Tax=Eikenella longinqua TaxID=1795827 RepID=A0A1A9RYI1_9NEIS|nr:hypothetical protein [Eikenella longinqua]OAM29317.1 hypothetical protein A7P95_03650 [Eikenella longinqua]